jgi:chromate transporter
MSDIGISLAHASAAGASPSFAHAVRVWAKIGLLSFGGPTAQIALMHRVIVEEKNWLSEQHYLNALSFCMLLPGPEAMQLATYAGWRLHGLAGGLAAGLLFVLPGATVVLALSLIYASFGNVPLVEAVFYGIKAAVLIIVIEALLRISKRALKLPLHWAIAAVSFVGIFFLELPFPLIIAAAAAVGVIMSDKRGAAEGPVTSWVSLPAGWRFGPYRCSRWQQPWGQLTSCRSSAGSSPSWPSSRSAAPTRCSPTWRRMS